MLPPARVYDSNGAIIAAAVVEAGGEPVPFGAFADNEAALELAMRAALADCDLVVLCGGTSKGAGDLSHRVVSRLGQPGILVHGVALKPGKPLCLAVARRQAARGAAGVSHLGDLHLPRLRGACHSRPRRPAAGGSAGVEADVPVRIASELGRKEFVLVALVAGDERPVAFPTAKGSGAVTSFSQADGFVEIDALAPRSMPARRTR